MNLDELLKLYEGTKFPDACQGKMIGETNLQDLEIKLSSLAHAYQETQSLNPEQAELLYSCRDDLEEVLQNLKGEEYDYFEILRLMAGCMMLALFKMENPNINQNAVWEPRHHARFFGGQLDGLSADLDKAYPEFIPLLPHKNEKGEIIKQKKFFYKLASNGPPLRYEFVRMELIDPPAE